MPKMTLFTARTHQVPSFCGGGVIHNFWCNDQYAWEKLSRNQREKEALAFLHNKMNRHRYGCYVMYDVEGSGLHKYITSYLPKEFEFDWRKWIVIHNPVFTNPNSRNPVYQTIVQRAR